MRWAASDVSPSSHLAFHIPTLAGFCLLFGFVALVCFCFLVCECLGIPNSPRSLDLDDRQGLIARSAMQQKKKCQKDIALHCTEDLWVKAPMIADRLFQSAEELEIALPSALRDVYVFMCLEERISPATPKCNVGP